MYLELIIHSEHRYTIQKFVILFITSYSLFSCGSTQYAEDATTIMEEKSQPATEIKVNEVVLGKVEGMRPMNVCNRSETSPD